MNRRQLLTGLSALPLAIIVPELLLPKRTYFLPPMGGWRSVSADYWHPYPIRILDNVTLLGDPDYMAFYKWMDRSEALNPRLIHAAMLESP